MKFIPQLLLSAALIGAAPAAITFTFDTDTQGFGPVSWNTGNGTTAWSANNGGSMAISTTTAGWSNPVSVLGLTSNPALSTEYNNMRLYGGTLSFDYIVSQADIIGYNPGSPPGWYELVVIGNSDGAAGGGWDQNVIADGFYGGVPTGPTTKQVTMTLQGGAPNGSAGVVAFGPASAWGELMFGFNSESGKFTGATLYLDNISFAANPAPEPAAAGLGLLAIGSLALRRRR